MTRAQYVVGRNRNVGWWTILSSGCLGFFGLWILGLLGVPFDSIARGSPAFLLALVFFFFTALSGFGRCANPHPFLLGAVAVVSSALTGAFGLMTLLGLLPG